VRDALGALARHGIRVVVTEAGPAERDTDGAEWARPLARLARSGWLAPWPADGGWGGLGGKEDDYLLDLACARECAQADAVVLASGRHGGAGEYEFTRWLDEPALVRADLLGQRGPAAGDWGSHGLRLFTITPGRAGG
jgi:hypothetical protein